jgi:hypothetical protein
MLVKSCACLGQICRDAHLHNPSHLTSVASESDHGWRRRCPSSASRQITITSGTGEAKQVRWPAEPTDGSRPEAVIGEKVSLTPDLLGTGCANGTDPHLARYWRNGSSKKMPEWTFFATITK